LECSFETYGSAQKPFSGQGRFGVSKTRVSETYTVSPS
jgi:hypothetical protein